ncbi:agmatine deiminase family protein [Rhodohalobacter sp. 8-1]|uniref:agmatine deiminase family protein n=1 Tax=Rhodohalobacter sp. 8-1 TaxID=3131972 RepID=UPI0030EEFF9E
MKYPIDDGFRMPAEWKTHSGILLIWPHNRDTWPGKRLDAVETVYKNVIRTLLKYEPVVLLVANDGIKKRAVTVLGDISNLTFPLEIRQVPVNDVWARDSGPIFIKQIEKETYRLTNWEFNSWGGKYEPWDDDNRIPEYISSTFSIPAYSTGKILEGGSIETNGEGLFLTTESVLLNPNRNPGLSKAEAEQMLKRYLGAEKVIWLKRGLKGDDTDGHIDDLTRFVNKNTVITALTEDQSNPNHDILYENLEILLHSTDLAGNPLHVITAPLPNTRIEDATVDGSDHVPSSYANFYIANGAVLVPMYDSRTDQQVLDLFSILFPDREIEGITCNDLVWGQGSIHCITQQLYGISIK